MSSVITIDGNSVVCEENHRLMRCPKCGEWNRIEHQRLVDKVLVVTCKRCGTRYRPK